jgi:hypothetical protein
MVVDVGYVLGQRVVEVAAFSQGLASIFGTVQGFSALTRSLLWMTCSAPTGLSCLPISCPVTAVR